MTANENAGSGLPSLWVAAAINVDSEDPFFDSDEEAVSDEEEDYGETSAAVMSKRRSRSPTRIQFSPAASTPVRSRQGSVGAARAYGRSFSVLSSRRPSNAYAPFARFPSLTMTVTDGGSPERLRRPSTPHSILPAIYANTGVTAPPALLDALGASKQAPPNDINADPFLESIVEGQVSAPGMPAPESVVEEKRQPTFQWTLLPLFVIFQYFILALHTTSHDQVFLMYLTS
jgi:hypothetical protein